MTDSRYDRGPVRVVSEVTPRQPNCASDAPLVEAHRAQHVTGLIAMRRAGAAIRDRDEILRRHDHGLCVRARERDVQNVRQRAGLIPVDDRAQGFERAQCTLTKRAVGLEP